ncbi:MAG: AAA family ATPase, partial [Chloroflexales bacterium]|nr:AAA family ATPase [Chloroflexales bacterium]
MTQAPQRPQFNPFHYGNPVPPSRFIGRAEALRTVFGRINNGESTAVVGEPHIGKSSMLHYVRRNWPSWLATGAPYAFIAIDCHALRLSYTPADFWGEVLDAAGEVFTDPVAQQRIAAARAGGFDSSRLRRVFEHLALHEQRAVLLVDEFDVLLY